MNIVFDLDGTLIDSAPDIQAVAEKILGKLGKPPLTIEETRDFIGEGAKILVSRMMASRGIEETPESHAQIFGDFVGLCEQRADLETFTAAADQPVAAYLIALNVSERFRIGHVDPAAQESAAFESNTFPVISRDRIESKLAQRHDPGSHGAGLAGTFHAQVAMGELEAAFAIPVLHIENAIHTDRRARLEP